MKIHHVKRAAKDYPEDNIKKGDEYFYCRPDKRKAGVVKIRRKTYDEVAKWEDNYARSFMGEMATNMEDWRERFDNLESNDDRDDLVQEIQDFIDQKEDSKNNLPESLQDGHMINDQIQELEEFRDEVEQWDENEY